jgi:hypothetical protein
MAGFLGGALTGTVGGLAGSAISSAITSILVRPRSIDAFTADVTIEERHEDALVITQHPVETGSSITDHAYKLPAKLTIRCGWSNASMGALYGTVLSLLDGSFDSDYVRSIYSKFLTLQQTRSLVDVETGKRSYTNMLISRLSVVTDDKTENVLMMTCELQEILMASTSKVQVNGTSETGTKTLTPASKFSTATPR